MKNKRTVDSNRQWSFHFDQNHQVFHDFIKVDGLCLYSDSLVFWPLKTLTDFTVHAVSPNYVQQQHATYKQSNHVLCNNTSITGGMFLLLLNILVHFSNNTSILLFTFNKVPSTAPQAVSADWLHFYSTAPSFKLLIWIISCSRKHIKKFPPLCSASTHTHTQAVVRVGAGMYLCALSSHAPAEL